MSIMTQSTPFYGRRGSLSALDFAYWAMDMVQSSLVGTATVDYIGAPSDRQASVQMVMTCAAQIGLALPGDFQSIIDTISNTTGGIYQDEGIATRGALLFKNWGIAISLGDGKRIVCVENGIITCRNMTDNEKAEGFWDYAGLLPWVRYA